MFSFEINDGKGFSLRSSYETLDQLCDALSNNVPRLGRYLRKHGLPATVANIMAQAHDDPEWSAKFSPTESIAYQRTP